MKHNFSKANNTLFLTRGISLVEIVIAASIFLVAVVSIQAAFVSVVSISIRNMEHLQAAFLAEEGVEAVKSIRDDSWDTGIDNKTVGTTYYLQWGSNKWSLSSQPSMIDQKFTRTVVLSPVSRDSSGNVVSAGGSVDNNSHKVAVSVAWFEGSSTATKTMEAYISDVFGN